MKRKRIWQIGLGLALMLGLAELGVRLTGVVDFPVYDVDARIGYIPQAGQSGKFLRRNAWSINARGMGSPAWQPGPEREDVLVIGDSVVWGGNPLTDADKLGHRLQAMDPQRRYWSAAAGSWSILNILAYFERYPDVAPASDRIVVVLNGGDFAGRSQWKSDSKHPRQRPLLASGYVWRKYGQPRLLRMVSRVQGPQQTEAQAAAAPARGNWAQTHVDPATVAALAAQLAQWRSERPERRLVVVLYGGLELQAPQPDSAVVADHVAMVDLAREAFGPFATIVDVNADPRWHGDLYRDPIHPNADGNGVLAAIIHDALAAQ